MEDREEEVVVVAAEAGDLPGVSIALRSFAREKDHRAASSLCFLFYNRGKSRCVQLLFRDLWNRPCACPVDTSCNGRFSATILLA